MVERSEPRRGSVDSQLVVETADYLTERLFTRISSLDDKLSERILRVEQKVADEDRHSLGRFALMETKIGGTKELLESRVQAGEKALDVAKAGLNETRAMAADQALHFASRTEVEAKLEGLAKQLETVVKDVNSIQVGKKESGGVWQSVAIMATLAISLAAVAATVLLHHS